MATVTQTQAAYVMQSKAEELSSHQIISLLMEGALERAKQVLKAEDEEERSILLARLVAIIEGLRNSLDMQAGGEIAENLNELYLYIVDKLNHSKGDSLMHAISEVIQLVNEVKLGWDNMELDLDRTA